jgi:hypothetical protein
MAMQKGQPANEYIAYCYTRAAGVVADPRCHAEANSLRVLDLATGKEIHCFESALRCHGFSFSPDGRYAAAGSFRVGVYLWRLPKSQPR